MKKCCLLKKSIIIIGVMCCMCACSSKNVGNDNTTGEQETKEQETKEQETKEKTVDELFDYVKVKEGQRILAYKDADTKVVIPEEIAGYPVVEIGALTFKGCEFVEEIMIPETIINIDGDTLTGTKWYEQLAPNTVVGDGILIKIDHDADELVIDENVKRIMDGLLVKKCPKKVIVNSPNIVDNQLLQGSRHIEHLVIGEKVTKIEGIASGCVLLKAVEFSENLTVIGEASFSNCSGLTSLVIPDTVEYIDEKAFEYCKGLEEIVLPKDVKLIAVEHPGEHGEHYTSSCFRGCEKLEKVTLTGAVELDLETFKGTPFYDNVLKTTDDYIIVGDVLVGYQGKSRKMNIPNGVKCIAKIHHYIQNEDGTGLVVKTGVSSDEYFEQVTIPKSVEKIGREAFTEGYYKLDKITIPGSVKTISNYAFDSLNTKIMYIEEGVETIEQEAFYVQYGSWGNVETLVLPGSIKSIGRLDCVSKVIAPKGSLGEEAALKEEKEFEEK